MCSCHRTICDIFLHLCSYQPSWPLSA